MFNKQQEQGFELLLLGLDEEGRKHQLEMRKRAEKLDKKKREDIRVEKLRLKRLRDNQLVICEICDCRITRKNLKRHQLTDVCRNNSIKEREWKNKEKIYLDKIKELEDKIKSLSTQ